MKFPLIINIEIYLILSILKGLYFIYNSLARLRFIIIISDP